MCIMFGKLAGIPLPDEDTLDNCYTSNRDGMGVAFATGGHVFIKKDFMTHGQFKEWLYKNIRVEDSAIVHYRLGTAGLKDCGNAHPFPVSQDKKELRATETSCDIAMAHNGVLRGLGDNKYSDTQEFIMNIVADPIMKANLHHKPIITLLMAYLDNSKLLFLHGDGTIWKYGEFTDDDNKIFYSNQQFKGYKKWQRPNATADEEFNYGYGDDFGCGHNYGNNGYKTGRVYNAQNGIWEDKPSLIEMANKQIDGAKSGLITVMMTCIECDQAVPERKMYRVYDTIMSRVAYGKLCKQCYHSKGHNKYYQIYDSRNEKHVKGEQGAIKEGDNARISAN